MKKLDKQNGITLVALVITIIILLILAGISISALTNQGIFTKTKQAKQKAEEAEKQQNKILKEYETVLDQYDAKTLVYKVNNGTIKIGDYVSYTPDTLSNDELQTLKDNLRDYSGKSDSTINSSIQRDLLNWRVFDVKDGQVRLISETPTPISRIELKGFDGYNNAVKLKDNACKTLYTNSKLVSKVQNLKIEDITMHMNTQPTEDKTQYSPANINYPKILEQEENQIVEKTDGTSAKLDVNSQDGWVIGKDTSATSILKNTFWNQSMNNTNSFKDNKYYELFIKNGENVFLPYWMSSRCVGAYSNYANFGIRGVYSGDIGSSGVYGTDGGGGPAACAFRPIITLKSDVQIDAANNGDGSEPNKAYVIK